MNNIIAVIPTRGLVYARTLKSLRRNGITDIEIVDGFGIPECHNECVRRTLNKYVEWVLFIEDDMEIPDGAIDRMLKVDAPIVFLEYPLDNGYSTVAKENDSILWGGLGCTLVRQSIFRQIPDPWFETNYSYKIEESPFKLEKLDIPNKYGGQDINFFLKCRNYGYTGACLPGIQAKHLRSVVERKEKQDGRYQITELPPIQYRAEYTS